MLKSFEIERKDVPQYIYNEYMGYSTRQQCKKYAFDDVSAVSYADVDGMLPSSDYLAARKYSGRLFFTIYRVGPQSKMYMFERSGKVFAVPIECPHSFTCEMVWSRFVIRIIDCVYAGKDELIRFVPHRYNGIREVAENLKVEGMRVFALTFHSVDYVMGECNEAWDGIIFVPKAHRYFGASPRSPPVVLWHSENSRIFCFHILSITPEYGLEPVKGSPVDPPDKEENLADFLTFVTVDAKPHTFTEFVMLRMVKVRDADGIEFWVRVSAQEKFPDGGIYGFRYWETGWGLTGFTLVSGGYPLDSRSEYFKWERRLKSLYDFSDCLGIDDSVREKIFDRKI